MCKGINIIESYNIPKKTKVRLKNFLKSNEGKGISLPYLLEELETQVTELPIILDEKNEFVEIPSYNINLGPILSTSEFIYTVDALGGKGLEVAEKFSQAYNNEMLYDIRLVSLMVKRLEWRDAIADKVWLSLLNIGIEVVPLLRTNFISSHFEKYCVLAQSIKDDALFFDILKNPGKKFPKNSEVLECSESLKKINSSPSEILKRISKSRRVTDIRNDFEELELIIKSSTDSDFILKCLKNMKFLKRCKDIDFEGLLCGKILEINKHLDFLESLRILPYSFEAAVRIRPPEYVFEVYSKIITTEIEMLEDFDYDVRWIEWCVQNKFYGCALRFIKILEKKSYFCLEPQIELYEKALLETIKPQRITEKYLSLIKIIELLSSIGSKKLKRAILNLIIFNIKNSDDYYSYYFKKFIFNIGLDIGEELLGICEKYKTSSNKTIETLKYYLTEKGYVLEWFCDGGTTYKL